MKLDVLGFCARCQCRGPGPVLRCPPSPGRSASLARPSSSAAADSDGPILYNSPSAVMAQAAFGAAMRPPMALFRYPALNLVTARLISGCSHTQEIKVRPASVGARAATPWHCEQTKILRHPTLTRREGLLYGPSKQTEEGHGGTCWARVKLCFPSMALVRASRSTVS